MKIIYETKFVAITEKEYPHGWGFTAPLVEFSQDADPAWCSEMCTKHLSNEEFYCIGATPRKLINGFELFVDYPKSDKRESLGKMVFDHELNDIKIVD